MTSKVLHINISDAKGGASIAAYRLHNIMNNNSKISSKMLVLIKKTSDENVFEINSFSRYIARLSRLVNSFLGFFKNRYGLFSFGLIGSKLDNHPLVIDADIIYLHWINNGLMSWKSIFDIFSLGKNVVLFSHDMWFFSGGCHQSYGGGDIVLNNKKFHVFGLEYFNNRFLKKLVISSFEKKVNAYSNYENIHVIVPSSQFYNFAIKSNIISDLRLHFIPNILNTEKFLPNNLVNNKKIQVLYGALGGKDNPYKGWEDFVFFAETISRKLPNIVGFQIFGYDFDDDDLNNLPFNVTSHGVVFNEDSLIKIYQNTDYFIFPSSQESYGQTLVEAMSCGVIPIAYDVGIASDVIINFFNGVVVKSFSKKLLVNAFEELIKLDLNELKKNVRKTILNNQSKSLVLQKHLNLIFNIS